MKVSATEITEITELPLAPKISLPYLTQLRLVRDFHTAGEVFRDSTGPVARMKLAPSWVTPEIVWVASPQGAYDALSAPAGVVDKDNPIHSEMRNLLGRNLFDLPDVEWHPRRRVLQPVFGKQRVGAYGAELVGAAHDALARWRETPEIDLDAECRVVTLDALGRSVLGRRFDDPTELGTQIRTVLTYIGDRAMRPVNLPRSLPTPAQRRARRAQGELRDSAAAMISRCRTDPELDAPLVRALLTAVDPQTGHALTDEQLTEELIVFLGAGHDTTATTLAYSLWQLGCAPEIQDRVRAEALTCGTGTLEPDDLGRLGYTVQVLHEALRLCPPGAGVARKTTQDVVICGYRVPSGVNLVIGFYAIHRDPSIWDDPLRFDPERFAPERMKDLDKWQYMPFGAGRRSCIGSHFAMLEATLALATLVRDCEIESLADDFPIAVPFTTVAAEPIPARIRLRT